MSDQDYRHLEQAIAALEAQRAVLGDAVVETALASLREKLAALEQAKAPMPDLMGERKLVTIVFADISGFTALAETADPEAVRDLMNACFERLVPVIEKFEGTVDKFIGDEIMALFGAPVAHENDPERALRAALEMMEALEQFNAERGTELSLHLGINTGLVIAGGLGTREQQAYSVMGDAVNLAARLEDVAERGEILVGPDTHRLTAPSFEVEALEPIQVKGKAEPVPVYRLLAAKAVPGKLRGIEGLDSPLVGRQSEFQALAEAVERLGEGQGGIVTIVGEAGLGKSRLVAEIASQAQTLSLSWIEGRCLSFGKSIAYLFWLDVLRRLLGVEQDASPAVVRDSLQERVQSLCLDCFDEVYPYLGRLMSLPLAAEDEAWLQSQEGEKLKRNTFRAVERLVESAARRRPLVLVCEDLHWADPTSIELLERLLTRADRVPLLFVCVFRPYAGHGCWRIKESAARLPPHRHTDLWLDPLSDDESALLVENLLRVQDLPPELRERILSRAEGNPFYVEEIIRSLMDDGAIVRDEGTERWIATREVDDIAIPDTLHGVLVARIDRLREETKRILQLASVIGRLFFYRILADIAQEERQLGDHLLILQQEEMIRERARVPELEYIFKHQLTQEAAYRGLLRKERRVFHRQVAEALERLFPERVEEQVGLLAYHWERAEEPNKAVEYLLRAGDQARLVYAHQEAAGYYQRALAFLRQGESYELAARTLMKLGLAYQVALDFQNARQAYEEGFALWQKAGEAESVVLPPAPHALRMVLPDSPAALDPAMTADIYSAGVMEQLFSGLVELGPEMGIVPDVARSWEVSEGGRKYVFYLRDDARWSDGSPVTAGDFEYAWKRALDPATRAPLASLLHDIKGARAFNQGDTSHPDSLGVQALDERTLIVELEGPLGYFLQLLTHHISYPVPRHVLEAHGDAWTQVNNIVTNGPFRLETWPTEKLLTFVRNPEYHGRFGGNAQRVELLVFAKWSEALEAYQADGLDACSLRDLALDEMDAVRRRYAGEHMPFPRLTTLYVEFDASRPPFDDVRVRQAFALAIDKERLANVVLRGYVVPALGGFVPPGMPGHSAGISPPYDPERARQLLAEAGYPGGRAFPAVNMLTFQGVFGGGAQFECLQTQWQENLGVELTWETLEWAAFFDRMKKDPPLMYFLAWSADYPDPDDFLRVAIKWRGTGWQNDAYDGLVEKAGRIPDQAERMRLYQEADKILLEEASVIPLTYGQAHQLLKPWVSKFPSSTVRQWFWQDVIIESH